MPSMDDEDGDSKKEREDFVRLGVICGSYYRKRVSHQSMSISPRRFQEILEPADLPSSVEKYCY